MWLLLPEFVEGLAEAGLGGGVELGLARHEAAEVMNRVEPGRGRGPRKSVHA